MQLIHLMAGTILALLALICRAARLPWITSAAYVLLLALLVTACREDSALPADRAAYGARLARRDLDDERGEALAPGSGRRPGRQACLGRHLYACARQILRR